jgi:hypothetical protein
MQLSIPLYELRGVGKTFGPAPRRSTPSVTWT